MGTLEIAAFVISVVAILIALGSLKLSVRADRREEGADKRDARREKREVRGKPIVTPDSVAGGSTADPVTHSYKVTNAGQSTITALSLWIEDGHGKVVSTPAGGEGNVLTPGGSPAFMGVAVRQPLPEEQVLMVAWSDADGEHEGPTGIRPQRHA